MLLEKDANLFVIDIWEYYGKDRGGVSFRYFINIKQNYHFRQHKIASIRWPWSVYILQKVGLNSWWLMDYLLHKKKNKNKTKKTKRIILGNL